MSEKVNLKLDWCNYETAKFAVMNWHYSKRMPVGKLVKIGVWEDNRFIGCVLFGCGSNRHIGRPYDLKQSECCELVRIALTNHHQTPVSKIISIAIKLLTKHNPGLRLIISYSDMGQKHLGIIYQASNWIYIGNISKKAIILNGKIIHSRSVSSRYGTYSIQYLRKYVDAKAKYLDIKPKHKYLYPLNRKTRKEIEPLAKPYPKNARLHCHANDNEDLLLNIC